MRVRRSVRNYARHPLSVEQRLLLMEAADAAESPFGGDVSIRLKRYDIKGKHSPGTYGFVRGAFDFFLIAIDDSEESQLSAGFMFEQVVLRATQLHLGTCWIGGTFKETVFGRGQIWPDGQQLRAICPVGLPERPTLLQRIATSAMGSDRRKPFGKLFFDSDFNSALPEDSAFGASLEMMRIAPSSTNSQPWRALVESSTVHFYCVPKSRYWLIDCGIGLCHFYATERYYQRNGQFTFIDNPPEAPAGLRYITSYSAVDG